MSRLGDLAEELRLPKRKSPAGLDPTVKVRRAMDTILGRLMVKDKGGFRGESEVGHVQAVDLTEERGTPSGPFPTCLPQFRSLQRKVGEQGDGVGYFKIDSAVLEPAWRGTHDRWGKRLYKAVFGQALKEYPEGVYFGADKCHWGSTSDDAKYVWQSLAKEYPHAGQGNRMILWVGR